MGGQNTSSTSISVRWDEVQAELQNGAITGYNITYQSLIENDSGFVTAGPNDRQANLTGLKEFVEYNISVVAFTVKGDGPPFVFIVRTDQDSKSYNTLLLLLLLIWQSVSTFSFCLFVFRVSIATLRLMSSSHLLMEMDRLLLLLLEQTKKVSDAS